MKGRLKKRGFCSCLGASCGFSYSLLGIDQNIFNGLSPKIQIQCFHWLGLLKRRRATIKANDPIESGMAGIVIARLILHKIDHDSTAHFDDENQ